MEAGLKGVLNVALGTQWLKKNDKDFPKSFSPNNIKMIMITQQGVLIGYHISISGQPKIKLTEVRTRNKGERVSPNFINSILKARVLGCLEELYIEENLVREGYADINDLQYALCKSRSTTDRNGYRIRYIGVIANGVDLKMVKQVYDSDKGLPCLATNPLIQPLLSIVFDSPNNKGDSYIKYYNLVPQSYWMDRVDGELERHFKSLIKKVLDMQFETGLKALIKKDYDNLKYNQSIEALWKRPKTKGQEEIQSVFLKIFDNLYKSYALSESYLDKLIEDMGLVEGDKLKAVYEDFGVIGIYSKGVPVNRQKVMELLKKKNTGILQLNTLLSTAVNVLSKSNPDAGIRVRYNIADNLKELEKIAAKGKKETTNADTFTRATERDMKLLEDVYAACGIDIKEVM